MTGNNGGVVVRQRIIHIGLTPSFRNHLDRTVQTFIAVAGLSRREAALFKALCTLSEGAEPTEKDLQNKTGMRLKDLNDSEKSLAENGYIEIYDNCIYILWTRYKSIAMEDLGYRLSLHPGRLDL